MKKRLIKYISLFIVALTCILTIGLCCNKKTSAVIINEFPFDTTGAIGLSNDFNYESIEGLTSNGFKSDANFTKEYLSLENGLYCRVARNSSTVSTNTSQSLARFVMPRYENVDQIFCLVIYLTNYGVTNYSKINLEFTVDNAGTYTNTFRVLSNSDATDYDLHDKALFCYFNYYTQSNLDTSYELTRSIYLKASFFDSVELNAYLYKVSSKEIAPPVIDSLGNIVYNNSVYYNTENYLQYGADKYNEGLEKRQDVSIKDYLLNSTFSTTFYSSSVHSPDNVIGYSITTITESDFINDKLQIYDIWVRNAIDSFGTNWLDTGQYYYYDNEILFDKVLDNNAISVVFVGNSSVYDNEPYIKYTDNTIKVLTTDNLNSIYVFFTESEDIKYINTLGWSGYGEDYTGQYIYISIGGELYGLGYNEGLIEGNISGYNNGYGDGYEIGYNNGANDGYENGINASAGNTWSSIWDFIYNIFVFIGRFMDIEILPNIKIGYIVGIAIVFALFGFIINISK